MNVPINPFTNCLYMLSKSENRIKTRGLQNPINFQSKYMYVHINKKPSHNFWIICGVVSCTPFRQVYCFVREWICCCLDDSEIHSGKAGNTPNLYRYWYYNIYKGLGAFPTMVVTGQYDVNTVAESEYMIMIGCVFSNRNYSWFQN